MSHDCPGREPHGDAGALPQHLRFGANTPLRHRNVLRWFVPYWIMSGETPDPHLQHRNALRWFVSICETGLRMAEIYS